MRRFLPLLLVLLFAGSVSAQQLSVTTVRISSTAADALCVGGAGMTPATCVGGIKGSALILTGTGTLITASSSNSGGNNDIAVVNTSNTASSAARIYAQVAGASAGDAELHWQNLGVTEWTAGLDNSDSDSWVLAASGTLGSSNVMKFTTAGVMSVPGFGAHTMTGAGTGANSLRVQNTTAGAGNFGELLILRDGSFGLDLRALSSTFTTSTYRVQGGAVMESDGVGGLSIVTSDAAGTIRFYTGGSTKQFEMIDGGGGTGLFHMANVAFTTNVNVATLNNSPVAGNPAAWVSIKINGTTRVFPVW